MPYERTVLTAPFQDPNNGWPCIAIFDTTEHALRCEPQDAKELGRHFEAAAAAGEQAESSRLCDRFNARRGWSDVSSVGQAYDLLEAALKEQDPWHNESIEFA